MATFRPILLVSLVLFAGRVPTWAAGESASPKAWPKERYQQLAARSPFALATPVATSAPSAPFAANLYVTGLAKIGEIDYVYLSTRDQQTRYTLASGIAGPEDMSLVGIEWNPQIGKSKVTIQKGGETGVLEFDQAVIQAQPQAQVAPPPPQVPQPPQQIPGVRPGMTSGEAPRPGESRRRIRIIPTPHR